MSENFIKFKKRSLTIRWIKTLGVGLTAGFAVSGTLLLLWKLKAITLAPVFSILIGLGAALLSGAAVYLLLRRSDRALARQLDKKFALHEKVQTMLEYENERGTMFSLQREDTEASLSAIPVKSLKFQALWAYILAFVMATSVLVSALVIQPEEEEKPQGPIYDPPFSITEIQRRSLETLIEQVEGSKMDSPYKENVALALRDLLEDLLEADVESEKDAALILAMDEILAETDASSTAVELIEALWDGENENVRVLALGLNYYEFTASYDWLENEEWSQEIVWDGVRDCTANFITSFVHTDATNEEADESVMAADTAERLLEASSSISLSLTDSGIAETDPIYALIAKIDGVNETGEDPLYGIAALAEQAETLGYEQTIAELTATLTVLETEIYDVLEQSCINTSIGEYAVRRVASIFNCSLPQFKRPSLNESSSGSEGGDGSTTPPLTDSENVYGSDEKVLNPETGEYVEYGEIFGGYNSNMIWKTENGEYTEEAKEIIKKYFEILNGGFKEEGESNE